MKAQAGRRTLITGAGGFIGGRFVEAMLQLEGVEPVPSLRRWSTAARIGRYPIEPVQCDLMNPDQIAGVVSGMDSIIHTAVGNREVTVQGTRNLLTAALEAGVRRVVHLSTIDVYGTSEGSLDESAPLLRTGREYGDSKIEAEEVCQEFVKRGLEVVMLRPTIVYGPHSDLWTVEPAVRLWTGSWRFPREACQGTCNLVYVDDLVRGAILALDAPGVAGKAYNINGADRPTWQDYVEALNAALHFPDLESPPPTASKARSIVVEPFRKLVWSTHLRFEEPIAALHQRSRRARGLMKSLKSILRRVPASFEIDLYGRVVEFPTTRAEADLGYRPQTSMARGVELSAEWLLYEGVVGDRI